MNLKFNNNFVLLLLVSMSFSIFVCGCKQKNIENEVISDLIKNRFNTQQYDTIYSNGKIVSILPSEKIGFILITETDTTYAKWLYDSLDEGYDLDQECYLDYIEKNKTVIKIDSISFFNGEITYLSKNEYDKIFKNGGWDNYYNRFGDLFNVKVSRPGFNKAKNKAIINISTYSGPLSGGNLYLLLEKHENTWKIKEIISGSVS